MRLAVTGGNIPRCRLLVFMISPERPADNPLMLCQILASKRNTAKVDGGSRFVFAHGGGIDRQLTTATGEHINLALPRSTPIATDGKSLVSVANGKESGAGAVICEHHHSTAIRTKTHRMVYYAAEQTGELYDRTVDPGELHNLWESPEHLGLREELLRRILDYHMDYRRETDIAHDQKLSAATRYTFSQQLHKGKKYYSDLLKTYTAKPNWPRQ